MIEVSIGLPVYNGAHLLRRALDSLLGQDFGDFELIISDNASTDDTRDICEDYARRDRRIRYSRNARNLGVMPNFHCVRGLASADYFMWASHDDVWSANYVGALARRLDANESAVLSAGCTQYVTESGEPDPLPMNHAPPSQVVPTEELVTQLLREHPTSWFYGLYRRVALGHLVRNLERFPVWGGDMLFLLDCCLNHDVVGDESAVIFKHNNRASRYRPITPRQRTAWQFAFAAGVAESFATTRLPLRRRWTLRAEVQRYLRERVFNKSLRGTARQWARAALAVGRGDE